MKNFRIKKLILFTALMLGLASSNLPASTKPTQPKNVLGYFLLLPQHNYFEDSVIPKSKREAWLYQDVRAFPGIEGWSKKSIVDIKNDYIFCPGDGAQGTLQVALFRYKSRVVVAVRNEFEEGRLDFLVYEKGTWKNVTKRILPVRYRVDYDYKIPRYGTTIQVTKGRNQERSYKMYDLIWASGRFKVRK